MPRGNEPLGDVANKFLFENDRVRVWNLDLAPGESSDWHVHDNDYVTIVIDPAQLRREADGPRARGPELPRGRDPLPGCGTGAPGDQHRQQALHERAYRAEEVAAPRRLRAATPQINGLRITVVGAIRESPLRQAAVAENGRPARWKGNLLPLPDPGLREALGWMGSRARHWRPRTSGSRRPERSDGPRPRPECPSEPAVMTGPPPGARSSPSGERLFRCGDAPGFGRASPATPRTHRR